MALVEGFDGSQLHVRERPIPGTSRKQSQTIRCKPGSFEWRFGRGKPGTTLEMLFIAGSDFNRIFERAGLDAPRGVDWSKAGASQWNGLPPARLVALEQWKRLTQDLGKLVTARLIQYIVEGKTAEQVGRLYGMKARPAAIVLENDLKSVAVYFGYAPGAK